MLVPENQRPEQGDTSSCQDPPESPLSCPSSPCDDRGVSRWGTAWIQSSLVDQVSLLPPTRRPSVFVEKLEKGFPARAAPSRITLLPPTQTHTHTHTHTVPGAEAPAQPDCSRQYLIPKKRAESEEVLTSRLQQTSDKSALFIMEN